MDSVSDYHPHGDAYKEQWKALGSWFLGPRAENCEVFMDIFKELFEKHVHLRNNYFPSDPSYISDEMRSSEEFRSEVEDMRSALLKASEEMAENVPFFSPRYQAHMMWDTTLPSILGYMSAMLFNQNNGDSAASPVTTLYEITVGKQLCSMLGFNVDAKKELPLAWGHITGGGSIANIEALWASRNLKFVPLAVKATLLNDEALSFLSPGQVKIGLSTPLFVYNPDSDNREPIPIGNCNNWQLLNMNVDDICDLKEHVTENMSKFEALDEKQLNLFKEFVEKEGVMSKGLLNFTKKHGLENSPIYTAPANNHYSWPKAGTVLGLGSDALISVQLDVDFRQDAEDLKKKLDDCLERKIPVLAVVAVIGSTEQSAVDPIKEMYELREEFKAKGLNFALLVDGAWGGYFKTMIIGSAGKEAEKKQLRKVSLWGYVPYCGLSSYVEAQYRHIQLADTITIDPHKSGFCPYPGGALCYRNGKMRHTIALFHPEVFHGENDPAIAMYGIGGSMPGAAPAGILISHNVIGLSNRGYGRILGQCNTTAKLFYCVWLTVARDDDPFVCVPLQGVPEGYDLESAKKLIKEKMAYKSMSKVFSCRKAFQFLTLCGPDTAINTFGVNFKGNTSVEKSNKLQVALSDAMNIFVDGTSAKRVPLILMPSAFDAKTHGKGLKVFKKKLGLDEDDMDMNVMVNSCMNPWQNNESIFALGDLFRQIVLNCMGRIDDAVVKHRFVLASDTFGEDDSIFIEYKFNNDIKEHLYQVSARVGLSTTSRNALQKYIQNCAKNEVLVEFETVPEEFVDDGQKEPGNLYNIMHEKVYEIPVKLVNDSDNKTISFKVLDIPRYQRLDKSSSVAYPENQKYFIYGDSTRTIMSHVISKLPDFQHTVALTGRPHSLTEAMLDLGVEADVSGVEGNPLAVDGHMIPPLQRKSYPIRFRGERYSIINTTINIKDSIYFNEVST